MATDAFDADAAGETAAFNHAEPPTMTVPRISQNSRWPRRVLGVRYGPSRSLKRFNLLAMVGLMLMDLSWEWGSSFQRFDVLRGCGSSVGVSADARLFPDQRATPMLC